MEIKLLYANLDGLDMSFHGIISDETCEALEAARLEAESAASDVVIDLGGIPVKVGQSGLRGGYRWRWSTGEDGETWFLKAPKKQGGDWDLRVSVNSAAFAEAGFQPDLGAIRAKLDAALSAWGWTPVKCPESGKFESPGRVDFCFDFRADEFVLEPDAIASKADQDAHWEVAAHYARRTCTSVTVGKMPGRQAIIYDKVREIIAKGKSYWWQVWGLDPEEKPKVWRVELRAGKNVLRQGDFRADSWDELVAILPAMLSKAVDLTRLILPIDSNVTRCPDAPLWERLRAAVRDVMSNVKAGLPRGTVKETVRERFDAQMRQMLRGVAVTHAAVMVGRDSVPGVIAYVKRIAEGVLRELSTDTDDTLQHVQKARRRYRLLEVDEWREKRAAISNGFGQSSGAAQAA